MTQLSIPAVTDRRDQYRPDQAGVAAEVRRLRDEHRLTASDIASALRIPLADVLAALAASANLRTGP